MSTSVSSVSISPSSRSSTPSPNEESPPLMLPLASFFFQDSSFSSGSSDSGSARPLSIDSNIASHTGSAGDPPLDFYVSVSTQNSHALASYESSGTVSDPALDFCGFDSSHGSHSSENGTFVEDHQAVAAQIPGENLSLTRHPRAGSTTSSVLLPGNPLVPPSSSHVPPSSREDRTTEKKTTSWCESFFSCFRKK